MRPTALLLGALALAPSFCLADSTVLIREAPADRFLRLGDLLQRRVDVSATTRAERPAPLDVEEDADLPLSSEELEWLKDRYRAEVLGEGEGDGGGADIAFGSLQVIQTEFVRSECTFLCDPDLALPTLCEEEGVPVNIVLLIWTETTTVPNPPGVDVYIDEELVANVPGLPADSTGRVNTLFIQGVPTGQRTFRVEETNELTFDELSMEILEVQPFGDASNVQCAPGAIIPDDPATPDTDESDCTIRLGWANGGPLPESNTVLFNGANPLLEQANDDGFFVQTIFTIFGAAPGGTFDFTIIGFTDAVAGDGRAQYRGCFRSSAPCVLDCVPQECPQPVLPWFAQMSYGETAAEQEFLGLWVCGEEYDAPTDSFVCAAEGVDVLLDGEVVQTLAGDPEFLEFGLATGEYSIGLRSTCGESLSSTTEKLVRAVDTTPLESPVVDGRIALEFGEYEAPDAVVRPGLRSTWTVDEPAQLVFVYVNDFLVDIIEGGVAVGAGEDIRFFAPDETNPALDREIREDDVVVYQFFRYEQDQAFGAEPIVAGSTSGPALYVPGNCDGDANPDPQITDAIFLLASLFVAGSDAPTCELACDADGSDQLNLTDAVYVLQFLFLSGDAPGGWIDGLTPTCVAVPAVPGELDCATPLALCETEGPAPQP